MCQAKKLLTGRKQQGSFNPSRPSNKRGLNLVKLKAGPKDYCGQCTKKKINAILQTIGNDQNTCGQMACIVIAGS
jgi:hypothetical protein